MFDILPAHIYSVREEKWSKIKKKLLVKKDFFFGKSNIAQVQLVYQHKYKQVLA